MDYYKCITTTEWNGAFYDNGKYYSFSSDLAESPPSEWFEPVVSPSITIVSRVAVFADRAVDGSLVFPEGTVFQGGLVTAGLVQVGNTEIADQYISIRSGDGGETGLKLLGGDFEEWKVVHQDGTGGGSFAILLDDVKFLNLKGNTSELSLRYGVGITSFSDDSSFVDRSDSKVPTEKATAGFVATHSESTPDGASHALAIADWTRTVPMDFAGANSVNIPVYDSEDDDRLKVGYKFSVMSLGVGTTTIAAPVGVSINGTDNGSIVVPQFKKAELIHRAIDEWIVIV